MAEDRSENDVNPPAATWQGDNTHAAGKPTILKEDLELLTKWVRTDLFEKVKFLYNPDTDLQINGSLYKLFVNDCKGRLIGLKGPLATGDYRRIYVELLWQEANKRKRNLVANGLTTRRSTVYSAMQNRFIGEYDRVPNVAFVVRF